MSVNNVNNANPKPAHSMSPTIDEKTTKKTEEFTKDIFIEISSENRDEMEKLSQENKKLLKKIIGSRPSLPRPSLHRLINYNQSIRIHDAALINKIAGKIIFNLNSKVMGFAPNTSSEDLPSVISHAEQAAEEQLRALQDLPSDSKKTNKNKRPRKDVTGSSGSKSKKQRLVDTPPQHIVQPISMHEPSSQTSILIPIPVRHAPNFQTSIPSYTANNSNSEGFLSQQFVSPSYSYSTSSAFRPLAKIAVASQALVEQTVPSPANSTNETSEQRLEDIAPQHIFQPISMREPSSQTSILIPIPVRHAPNFQTSIPSYTANNSNSEGPLSQQFVSSSNYSYSTSSESHPLAAVLENPREKT